VPTNPPGRVAAPQPLPVPNNPPGRVATPQPQPPPVPSNPPGNNVAPQTPPAPPVAPKKKIPGYKAVQPVIPEDHRQKVAQPQKVAPTGNPPLVQPPKVRN
jgi:hypothetical protein